MRTPWKKLTFLLTGLLLYVTLTGWQLNQEPLDKRSLKLPTPQPARKCVTKAPAQSLPSNVIQLPFGNDGPGADTEVRLIIVTYMRSGSTFLGSTFDRHPSAMYVFEPLVTLEKMLTVWDQIGPLFWDRGNQANKEERKKEVMSAFLNCTYKNVYLRAFQNYFNSMANETSLFLRCHAWHPGILGVLKCLPLLQRSCQAAKTVVAKTIRYSMEEALKLMRVDPKLKIIHLLRDPRNTLRSQQSLGVFNRSTVVSYSRGFCASAESDLLIGDEMEREFPGRVIRVRFEDVSQHPVQYVRHLLKFAGLETTSKIEDYVRNVTEGNRSDAWANNVKEIVRVTNSSATASAWRDRYDFYHTSRIDSQCGSLYKLAGYLPLEREQDLKDLRVPCMLSVAEVPRFLRLT